MNSLEEIRERDAISAETWFREPALGACGRAFIDRRWLLAEIARLQADATRYRWLRDADPMLPGVNEALIPTLQGELLDQGIDMTLAAEPQSGKHEG